MNKLTDAETEIIAIFMEEAGECVHMAGKALRHGLDSYNPNNGSTTNREYLAWEIGDFLYAMHLLFEYNIIKSDDVYSALARRGENIGTYLHHIMPIYPEKTAYLDMMMLKARENDDAD